MDETKAVMHQLVLGGSNATVVVPNGSEADNLTSMAPGTSFPILILHGIKPDVSRPEVPAQKTFHDAKGKTLQNVEENMSKEMQEVKQENVFLKNRVKQSEKSLLAYKRTLNTFLCEVKRIKTNADNLYCHMERYLNGGNDNECILDASDEDRFQKLHTNKKLPWEHTYANSVGMRTIRDVNMVKIEDNMLDMESIMQEIQGGIELDSVTEDNIEDDVVEISSPLEEFVQVNSSTASTTDLTGGGNLVAEEKFQHGSSMNHQPPSEKGADGKRFHCSVCGRGFTQLNVCRRHMYKIHGKRDVYACPSCEETFSNLPDYKLHVKLHKARLKPFRCTECNSGFKAESLYKKHLRIAHSIVEDFPCSMCDKVFHKKLDRHQHQQEHKKETPFECYTCRLMFPSAQDLLAHKPTHAGEKIFSCKTCGKMFKYEKQCVKHEESHTDGSTQCSICDKTLCNKSVLKLHMKMHTEDPQYACEHCGKRYINRNSWRIHRLKHTAEPFRCHKCDRTFVSIEGFRKHIAKHEGITGGLKVCDICGKHTSSIARHMRSHSEERPFCCAVCSFGFKDKALLNRHLLTHSGAKPYACQFCDRAFARITACKVHMRTHIGEDLAIQPFNQL